MKQITTSVAIIGGGYAGIGAALALRGKGIPCLCVEKEDRLGGLACTIKSGDCVAEFGPHTFHTRKAQILEVLKDNVPADRLTSTSLDVSIRFEGRYFRYPLRIGDVLKNLPFKTTLACMLSLAYWGARFNVARLFGREPRNAQEWIVGNFGKRLYHIYYHDYQKKVLGYYPDRLSLNYARDRIPRINLVDLIARVLGMDGLSREGDPVLDAMAELTNYYPAGGASEILHCLHEAIDDGDFELMLNHEVNRVDLDETGRRIDRLVCSGPDGAESVEIMAEHFVSTMPLPELIQLINPSVPELVKHSSQELEYRGLVIVSLLIDRESALPSQWVYFYDQFFTRVTEPRKVGLKDLPPGTTVLLAEIPCKEGDSIWTGSEDLKEKVVDGLASLGFIRKEDVIGSSIIRTGHAYPVYKLGFEEHLQRVRETAARISNLHLAGRQGTFTYMDMDTALEQGIDAGTKVASEFSGKA